MLRTGGLPVLLLVAGTFPVWPQQIETDVAVLDRLRSVRTAYSLEIDRARAEAMLRVLEPVSKLQSDYASWAAEQWKANSTKVHAAISAWAASRQPAAEEAQAAQALLEGARDRQTRIDEAVLNAAPQATAALGAAGKTVETQEEAQRRKYFERTLAGARSPSEAILITAETLRLLMPDDYELVRLAEAERLADALAGAQGTASPAAVGAIAQILDGLMDLPPDSFVRQRPQLLAQIAQHLGRPLQEAAPPVVSWDDFLAWLRDVQTPTVLSLIAGKDASPITPPPEGFKTALAQLELLALISDLRLAPDQVAGLVQLVAQIGNDVDAANADRKALAERARELMPAVEAALRQGKPMEADMADKVQQILAEDDQTIGELKRAMADYLRRMARMLRPEQQRLVNWTPPGDVLRLIPAEFAAMRLRQRAAIIRRGLDFLNYLKYRTAKDYMNLKVSQSREFVAAFVDPRSPAYAQALEMTLDLVSEARMVAREEWEGGADVEYATHLMRAIGALRDPEAQEPTGQEIYTWQRLYDILTVPGVHQMFTEGGGH